MNEMMSELIRTENSIIIIIITTTTLKCKAVVLRYLDCKFLNVLCYKLVLITNLMHDSFIL
jgi:hypothetical protein